MDKLFGKPPNTGLTGNPANHGMSEREKRLKQREEERKNRLAAKLVGGKQGSTEVPEQDAGPFQAAPKGAFGFNNPSQKVVAQKGPEHDEGVLEMNKRERMFEEKRQRKLAGRGQAQEQGGAKQQVGERQQEYAAALQQQMAEQQQRRNQREPTPPEQQMGSPLGALGYQNQPKQMGKNTYANELKQQIADNEAARQQVRHADAAPGRSSPVPGMEVPEPAPGGGRGGGGPLSKSMYRQELQRQMAEQAAARGGRRGRSRSPEGPPAADQGWGPGSQAKQMSKQAYAEELRQQMAEQAAARGGRRGRSHSPEGPPPADQGWGPGGQAKQMSKQAYAEELRQQMAEQAAARGGRRGRSHSPEGPPAAGQGWGPGGQAQQMSKQAYAEELRQQMAEQEQARRGAPEGAGGGGGSIVPQGGGTRERKARAQQEYREALERDQRQQQQQQRRQQQPGWGAGPREEGLGLAGLGSNGQDRAARMMQQRQYAQNLHQDQMASGLGPGGGGQFRDEDQVGPMPSFGGALGQGSLLSQLGAADRTGVYHQPVVHGAAAKMHGGPGEERLRREREKARQYAADLEAQIAAKRAREADQRRARREEPAPAWLQPPPPQAQAPGYPRPGQPPPQYSPYGPGQGPPAAAPAHAGGGGGGALPPGYEMGPLGVPVRKEMHAGNRKVAQAYNQGGHLPPESFGGPPAGHPAAPNLYQPGPAAAAFPTGGGMGAPGWPGVVPGGVPGGGGAQPLQVGPPGAAMAGGMGSPYSVGGGGGGGGGAVRRGAGLSEITGEGKSDAQVAAMRAQQAALAGQIAEKAAREAAARAEAEEEERREEARLERDRQELAARHAAEEAARRAEEDRKAQLERDIEERKRRQAREEAEEKEKDRRAQERLERERRELQEQFEREQAEEGRKKQAAVASPVDAPASPPIRPMGAAKKASLFGGPASPTDHPSGLPTDATAKASAFEKTAEQPDDEHEESRPKLTAFQKLGLAGAPSPKKALASPGKIQKRAGANLPLTAEGGPGPGRGPGSPRRGGGGGGGAGGGVSAAEVRRLEAELARQRELVEQVRAQADAAREGAARAEGAVAELRALKEKLAARPRSRLGGGGTPGGGGGGGGGGGAGRGRRGSAFGSAGGGGGGAEVWRVPEPGEGGEGEEAEGDSTGLLRRAASNLERALAAASPSLGLRDHSPDSSISSRKSAEGFATPRLPRTADSALLPRSQRRPSARNLGPPGSPLTSPQRKAKGTGLSSARSSERRRRPPRPPRPQEGGAGVWAAPAAAGEGARSGRPPPPPGPVEELLQSLEARSQLVFPDGTSVAESALGGDGRRAAGAQLPPATPQEQSIAHLLPEAKAKRKLSSPPVEAGTPLRDRRRSSGSVLENAQVVPLAVPKPQPGLDDETIIDSLEAVALGCPPSTHTAGKRSSTRPGSSSSAFGGNDRPTSSSSTKQGVQRNRGRSSTLARAAQHMVAERPGSAATDRGQSPSPEKPFSSPVDDGFQNNRVPTPGTAGSFDLDAILHRNEQKLKLIGAVDDGHDKDQTGRLEAFLQGKKKIEKKKNKLPDGDSSSDDGEPPSFLFSPASSSRPVTGASNKSLAGTSRWAQKCK